MAVTLYFGLTTDRHHEGEVVKARLVPSGTVPVTIPLDRGGSLLVKSSGWELRWGPTTSSSGTWDFVQSASHGKRELVGPCEGTVVVIDGGRDGKRAFALWGVTRDPSTDGIWAQSSKVKRMMWATPGKPEEGESGVVLHLGPEVQLPPAQPEASAADPDAAQSEDDDPFA